MNVAIIGCGHAGQKHLEVYQELGFLPNKFDISFYGASANWSSFLYGEKFDIASICTPSNVRADYIFDLAKRKCNLLVEKPLALTIVEAQGIIDVCHSENIILGVVLQKRFSPDIMQLRGEILAGVFGKPLIANMSVKWCRPHDYYKGWKGEKDKGGSILINQALHHIDILQWVLGPCVSVFSYSETVGHKVNTTDAVVATLKFENGSLAVLEASTVAYPTNVGESLTILSEWGHHKINTKFPYHKPIIENFVNAVREHREPMVTGEESLKSLKIALAMQESADTGKEVFL